MEVTHELLHELFEYKDGILYWKVAKSKRIRVGDVAGSKNLRGYLRIKIDSKDYLMHRLIFLMINGYLPKYIDHIDGCTLNNRIENLREATLSQNQFNRKLNKNNISGVKGVSWIKQYNKWRVRIQINGKEKSFGLYSDLELAKLVAEEARLKYHGDFANHG